MRFSEEAKPIPAVVETEIQRFEDEVARFRRSDITPDEFRPLRQILGIYSQRQPDVQLVRVKIPAGVLTPVQLRELSAIAEEFSNGRGHFTTRENCQFHFVQLEHVPAVMRRLAAVGLTTREACGNTVRTVTACPLAGVCREEVFDVTPYALAISRALLRHPEFHGMPRKFKIAFSGCANDGRCTLAAIHDVGLIARTRRVDGSVQPGFLVLVGGGLGSLPTAALPLTEFLPAENLLPTLLAILRVFNRYGNRENKQKARMKFILRQYGIERFRALVAEQHALIDPDEVAALSAMSAESPTEAHPPEAAFDDADSDHGFARRPAVSDWARYNLERQSQTGYAAVWVRLPAGNLSGMQMRGLADLLDQLELKILRVAVDQNLVIPWVRFEQAEALYSGLERLQLVAPGARTIADVTSCPGATTCSLAITRSQALAEILSEQMAGERDPETRKVRIKISGCPNSCGQHHIADIGLYGNARKVSQKLAPHYQLLLGGSASGDGARFARQVMVIPARHVPQALQTLLQFYRDSRASGEPFGDWALRTSDVVLREQLRPYTDISQPDPDFFLDWGDQQAYAVTVGRGECAG